MAPKIKIKPQRMVTLRLKMFTYLFTKYRGNRCSAVLNLDCFAFQGSAMETTNVFQPVQLRFQAIYALQTLQSCWSLRGMPFSAEPCRTRLRPRNIAHASVRAIQLP